MIKPGDVFIWQLSEQPEIIIIVSQEYDYRLYGMKVHKFYNLTLQRFEIDEPNSLLNTSHYIKLVPENNND